MTSALIYDEDTNPSRFSMHPTSCLHTDLRSLRCWMHTQMFQGPGIHENDNYWVQYETRLSSVELFSEHSPDGRKGPREMQPEPNYLQLARQLIPENGLVTLRMNSSYRHAPTDHHQHRPTCLLQVRIPIYVSHIIVKATYLILNPRSSHPKVNPNTSLLSPETTFFTVHTTTGPLDYL